ncbi:hypothetical protein [uncultured Methanolobus sp.]|uniref:hypothetical protein n=1 Tax=uncultured Methanolobus sp. TaxID=218300 RepID=UPI0029C88195|nr:hypothetical protein [uncultured Methanolobus sp.]
MTCPAFTQAIEQKMDITIHKAKNYLENRYGCQGEWVKSSLPDDAGQFRVELHVFSGLAPYSCIVADFASMKVKAFGPFMRYKRTFHATEVKP